MIRSKRFPQGENVSRAEIVNKIVEYFESKYDVKGEIEEENNSVDIRFRDAVEMSKEEYEEELYRFLRGLGFSPTDDWEYPILQARTYFSFTGSEQLKNHEETLQILTYYTKVSDKKGTSYFVSKIVIEEVNHEEE